MLLFLPREDHALQRPLAHALAILDQERIPRNCLAVCAGILLDPVVLVEAELERRAGSVKVRKFARRMILAELAKPAVPSPRDSARIGELTLEIRRVGVTVNQLAHAANATNELPDPQTLHEVMAQVMAVLDKVKAL